MSYQESFNKKVEKELALSILNLIPYKAYTYHTNKCILVKVKDVFGKKDYVPRYEQIQYNLPGFNYQCEGKEVWNPTNNMNQALLLLRELKTINEDLALDTILKLRDIIDKDLPAPYEIYGSSKENLEWVSCSPVMLELILSDPKDLCMAMYNTLNKDQEKRYSALNKLDEIHDVVRYCTYED